MARRGSAPEIFGIQNDEHTIKILRGVGTYMPFGTKLFRVFRLGILSGFLSLGLSPVVPAQQPSERPTPRRSPSRDLADDGWKIPGLVEFNAEEKQTDQILNGVPIRVITLKAERRPIVDLAGKTLGHIDEGDWGIDPKDVAGMRLLDVRSVSRLEANGKIFAYRVELVIVLVGENYRGWAGAMYRLSYSDEDGDGRFEVRHGTFEAQTVPPWALSDGASN